jgi:hypothetical protein
MVTSRDGQEIATYFVDYGPLSHTAYVGLRNWVKFVSHTTELASLVCRSRARLRN